jgi:hypothetical protein
MTDNEEPVRITGNLSVSKNVKIGGDIITCDNLSLLTIIKTMYETIAELTDKVATLEAKSKELDERLVEVEYAPNGVMCEQARLEFEELADKNKNSS